MSDPYNTAPAGIVVLSSDDAAGTTSSTQEDRCLRACGSIPSKKCPRPVPRYQVPCSAESLKLNQARFNRDRKIEFYQNKPSKSMVTCNQYLKSGTQYKQKLTQRRCHGLSCGN